LSYGRSVVRLSKRSIDNSETISAKRGEPIRGP